MKRPLACITLLLCVTFSYAQETFEFIGSEVEPQPEGFYIGGIEFDFNEDGTAETESGCPSVDVDPEDYERRDPHNVTYDAHNETGTHQGFSYKNVMILPDCDHKYIDDEEQIDPLVSHGFVQLRPLIDSSDVDIAQSYITSPYVRNLQSITIETSADISIQPDNRYIPYIIEYSLDSGETFVQNYYIFDRVDVRSGTRKKYDENDENFGRMMTDSKDKNVLLRFTGNYDNPDLGADKGQYVNIHKISIVADSAKAEEPEDKVILSSKNVPEGSSIGITNGSVYVEKGSLSVFTLSVQLVGKGQSVPLRKGQLYLVKTTLGETRKVFISH